MATKKNVEAVEPVEAVKEEIKAIVRTNLNFRKRPNTNAEIIRVLMEGEEIIVLSEDKEGWSKIKAGSSTGFVMSEFIEIL